MKSIANKLCTSIVEKDVENIYRGEFLMCQNDTLAIEISSPYLCDGILKLKNDSHSVDMMLEFKYDVDLKDRLVQCGILIQCIYYLKKMELDGSRLPDAVFVGDINECFIIHVNSLIKYLSYNTDWSIAPSIAYKYNVEMTSDMMANNDISPYVEDISNDFNICTIIRRLEDISINVSKKTRITKHNVGSVFSYFKKNILKSKLDTNESANLFIQIIVNPNDNYIHPTLKSTLVTKSFGNLVINGNIFDAFFKRYEGSIYSPTEKEVLTSLVDRLIEDSVRRSKGEFFTPTYIADQSHNLICNTFGHDWKDKYIVWDCAWGTGNLTRDYKFSNLYCSTLEQSDIDTANQMKYNIEANKFMFDFLNDDYNKLPSSLRNDIESGRDMIIFINPPYGKATPNRGNCNTSITTTMVNKMMIDDGGFGLASSQLSTQFLYRIIKLKSINPNINICIYNNPNYMTSDGFKEIRRHLLNNFGYIDGFLFNASHFSDTSNKWGIAFSIWDKSPNNIKCEFIHKLVDVDNDFCITYKNNKVLYNCDGLVKANIIFNDIDKNDVLLPSIKSFITIDESKKLGYSSAVGYINNHSNNQYQQNVVFLASSVISANGNKAITKEKFIDAMCLFTARKAIPNSWTNCKDEYLTPDKSNPKYEKFSIDSIVYSLFNNSSQQSSLRNIIIGDNNHNIKNEFFWMSNEYIKSLSNDVLYDNIYKDAKNDDDRFVYKILFQDGIYNRLSDDARLLLDNATSLVKKSMQVRKFVSENNPEHHLDSWDAGYAQLKLIWKEYFKSEFTNFRRDYKQFEERLRPLIYEFGFLK